MNNQQLIKQIETKIKNTQEKLEVWKQQFSTYENTLSALTQQLQEIKKQITKK